MTSPFQTSSVKFLIVDDREENLVALEALLRRDGLEILQARNGDAALEILLAHDVALALLDVQMPDMDGIALAELMRGSERTRRVPIIFVTAAAQEQHRVFEGYHSGAVDFIVKPIEPHILRHKASVFFDLYKQRQELAETLRVNEMFVAAIGHDLKTPLHSIVMATELLLQKSPDAAQLRHIGRIRSSSQRMGAMIDDLFDLARVRLGGGIPLECEPADLAAIIGGVAAECVSTDPSRVIRVECHGDTRGVWDRRRIEQIGSNLVGNALRHGSAGAPIDVVVTGEGADVSLSVHNSGTIPPDVRSSLFEPFRASESPAVQREGLGLGLFIVHQLTLAHGGTIDVGSTVELGTTFTVRLPKVQPRPAD